MQFWGIGLEWWILYALLFIFIVLVNDLGRTLYQIKYELKEIHSDIEFGFRDELAELQQILTSIEVLSID